MFDVKKHLIKVQGGRQYLPVAARLIWFRTEHPDWGIETKPITIDVERQYAIFESTVYDAAGKLMAKGTKMENIRGFGDWLEKAETGAIGRALAVCGYGTQFAPDLDESHNGDGHEAPYSRYGEESNRYDRGHAGETNGSNGLYRGSGIAADRQPAPSGSGHGEGLALISHDTAEPAGAVSTAAQGGQPSAPPDSCVDCSAVLKPNQISLSLRKFGSALCPDCQKKRKPSHAA